MKMIALIIMVSIVVEGLVEYGKSIMYMVEDEEYKTAITQGITIVLAVALSFVFRLHLFNAAMTEVYEGLNINPIIDMILTGILISRGSNYASDFIGKLTKRKSTGEDEEEGDDEDEGEDEDDEFTSEGYED